MKPPSASAKTNPIKPNFIRHSLREGGFKSRTYAALRGLVYNDGPCYGVQYLDPTLRS